MGLKNLVSKPALEVGVLEKIVIRPPQQVFRPNFPKPVTSGRVFAHVTVATVVTSTEWRKKEIVL